MPDTVTIFQPLFPSPSRQQVLCDCREDVRPCTIELPTSHLRLLQQQQQQGEAAVAAACCRHRERTLPKYRAMMCSRRTHTLLYPSSVTRPWKTPHQAEVAAPRLKKNHPSRTPGCTYHPPSTIQTIAAATNISSTSPTSPTSSTFPTFLTRPTARHCRGRRPREAAAGAPLRRRDGAAASRGKDVAAEGARRRQVPAEGLDRPRLVPRRR